MQATVSRQVVVSREARRSTYSGLRDHHSELFTRMIGLNFLNVVAQPLLQLSLSELQT